MQRLFLFGIPLMAAALLAGAKDGDPLAAGFLRPSDEAKPRVYWWWLNNLVNREGITADLEVLKRAGLGGLLVMDVAMQTPPGPARFMSPLWVDLFKHLMPKAWPTGKVTGLCARGGFEVEMSWDDGCLTQAVIHSKSGLPCKVVCGDQTWEFDTKAGKSYPLTLMQKVNPRNVR